MYPFNTATKCVLVLFIVYCMWMYAQTVKLLRKDNFSAKESHLEENLPTETELVFLDSTGKHCKGTKCLEEITREINLQNQVQWVRNIDKFGPLNNKTSVLVIQVHSRLNYLNQLIQSLSKVWYIENSLLIFSHDFYHPQINEVIHTIQFARVLQIFYPHSIQLHPTRFPGPSVDDCPPNTLLEIAQQIKCRNANHPDLHGRYRDANETQAKHHWWWKTQFVFDRVTALSNHTGVVAFLEEDHYVASDFLWVLRLLEKSMVRNKCHDCNVLSLGSYPNTWNKSTAYLEAVIATWTSARHTMGMAFNRSLWNILKRCAPSFCEYDDNNWDWTLLHVSQVCLHTPLIEVYPLVPRIFHIGHCEMDFGRNNNCDTHLAVKGIKAELRAHLAQLFPESLKIKGVNKTSRPVMRRGGGWGDLRDKELCLTFSMKTM